MRVIAAVLVVALWGTGCVQDARFDPRGCEWNLLGDWTIDDEPASAESCGDDSGGITEVQLFVWNEDDSETFSDSQVLLFPCNNTDPTQPDFLNTAQENPQRCMDTGRYLVSGSYRAQWVARDNLNNILDCTDTLVFPAPFDDTILFPTVPLFTDALVGSTSGILDLCPALENRPGPWP